MPGTQCAWCGSLDTQPGFDQVTCLGCGKQTSAEGFRTVATSHANEGVTVAHLEAEEGASFDG